ncbi:unnamed protein product [Lymnaea stagnalis]|uniref:Adenosine 5'-monophosphoramidase HINT3 n=1 Tax=Lymnaea stagnalis TaxID=6523 RepID=A0AAV2H794_LYMST
MAQTTPPEQPTCSKCIFCRIANNQEPKTDLLYQQDGIVIFKDLRPASDHHYLIIPEKHVKDPKHLGSNDVKLVEQLVSVGKDFLAKQGGDVTDVRMGFHWPPFNSISHLHLHVISPTKHMGFIASLIFKVNSYWFVSAEWLIDRLKKSSSSL